MKTYERTADGSLMEAPWAVLVAGSRELGVESLQMICDYLKPFQRARNSVLIHGDGPPGDRPGAYGCDRLAGLAAEIFERESFQLRVLAIPALWDYHRRAGQKNPAGPIRNKLMLEILCAHHAAGYRLAAGFFPTGGPGTAGMIRGTRSITTVPIQISEFPIEL